MARQQPSVTGYLVKAGTEEKRREHDAPDLHRSIGAALAVALLALPSRRTGDATKIERVVSPGGIEAWLVREPSVPLIALEFSFPGIGQDPADKAGGDLVARARRGRGRSRFQGVPARIESNAVEMSFRPIAMRSAARYGTCPIAGTSRSTSCDWRSRRRVSTAAVERVRAQMLYACCSARPRARTISVRGGGGAPPSPIILTAGRPTGRWNRCRRSSADTQRLYASRAGARTI